MARFEPAPSGGMVSIPRIPLPCAISPYGVFGNPTLCVRSTPSLPGVRAEIARGSVVVRTQEPESHVQDGAGVERVGMGGHQLGGDEVLRRIRSPLELAIAVDVDRKVRRHEPRVSTEQTLFLAQIEV